MVGSEDGQTGSAEYDVKELVVHPNYGQSMYDYDYSLLHINATFVWSEKVKPISFTHKAPKGNTRMVVAGWGRMVSYEGITIFKRDFKHLF